MRKFVLMSAIALTSLLACKNDSKIDIAEVEKVPGINLEFMDNSVKPSEDFFKHVNGKWLETTQIPDDQTRWGSFNELRIKTDHDGHYIFFCTF